MAAPRLFVEPELAAGARVRPSAGQAHYLSRTMRLGRGDAVTLFDGVTGEWDAAIVRLGRDDAELEVRQRRRAQAREPDLWLGFALLRRDATEWVVQKACELGVSALLPVLAERSVARSLNLERMRAIAMEAAEQCERLSVPRIEAPVALPVLLGAWPPDRPLLAAVERHEAPRIGAWAGGLLVGPEGGFARAELDALGQAPFVSAVSLGPRILRAETAAIAGLAQLAVHCGL